MTHHDQDLATEYAQRIAKAFYADSSAPFGYRDEADAEADTLDEVLDAAEVPADEREDYDAFNLPDEWRVASAMDYLTDALDFRYIVDSDRTYRHGEICIGLGGPNVWITTEDATVSVYWGAQSKQGIPYAVAEQLDEALGELWEMGA